MLQKKFSIIFTVFICCFVTVVLSFQSEFQFKSTNKTLTKQITKWVNRQRRFGVQNARAIIQGENYNWTNFGFKRKMTCDNRNIFVARNIIDQTIIGYLDINFAETAPTTLTIAFSNYHPKFGTQFRSPKIYMAIDSPLKQPFVSFEVPSTSDHCAFNQCQVDIKSADITGIHDLYLIFYIPKTNPSKTMEFDFFQFSNNLVTNPCKMVQQLKKCQ
ncbi:hypothetical protein CHUAL_012191 [Chamberlinius hualienensis]